jgi:SAM-dependent methyltransferase
MDVTNRFVLDFCRDYAREHPSAAILDFGCGAGELVTAGLAAGLPISGADVFYSGSKSREQAEKAGLLGGAVKEIRDNRLPFADACFGLIVNNQVMEHVDDLDQVLGELHRVLAPGGLLLSIFPSRDVFREGHIGIPFAHWFRKNSRARFYYTWALRNLGLGTWKNEAPTARQWAIDKLRWIDTYTRYRTRSEIFAAYGRWFESETREIDYIRYRLLDQRGSTASLGRAPDLVDRKLKHALPPSGRVWVAAALRFGPAAAAARAIFRKLAFFVILSRKVPQ